MNAGQAEPVAAQVEAAVRATPGVAEVYRSGNVLTHAVGAGVRRLTRRDDDPARVLVQEGDEGTQVHVAIGVEAGRGARETTAAVHRAVRDLLAGLGLTDARVLVTVVHVHDAAPV